MSSRVLIVEDEMVVQLHLSRIVSELGHEVVGTAMNAREALAIATRESPELVLMDVHLADGDDGVETAEELAREHDCAVVFVTAYADAATIERTGRVGAAGYVVKPFTPPAVRAAVSTAVAGHRRLRRAQGEVRTLSTIVDNLRDALFVVDEQARIVFANPCTAQLTGWSPAESEGRVLAEVVQVPAGQALRTLTEAQEEVRAAGESASWPGVVIRDRTGLEHTIDLEIEPSRDEDSGSRVLIVKLRGKAPRPAGASARSGTRRQRFGKGTRLVVYSHDTFGLGHLRRSLALIRAVCSTHPEASALLVTGSPLVHRYPMPNGADYVKLPAVRKVESERYEARTLHVSGSTIRSMRTNLILHSLRDFDPNVLLVDHSPLGSKGELLPALAWLRSRGGCTRILGLRDIIDEPGAVVALWKESGVYDVLQDHYDHVAVYGQRDVYDPVSEYAFPESVAAKTRFVNYVCDRSAPPDEDPPDGTPVVAVTIGGGDGGVDTLLVPFLEMMRSFRSAIDFRAEILTGPFVPAELQARLRALAEGLPVRLQTFIPSPAALFRRAELVVATAGYNTTVDLLAHGKRALFVPRVLYRQEQLIRARRLEQMGIASCLHPEEATPERLFETIGRARLDEPLTRARAEGRILLDGAERFAEFCGSLLVDVREEG